MKNPIRSYLNWYGRNLTEISTEPAGKAIWHYSKFTMKTVGIGMALATVILAGFAIGDTIREKREEDKRY